MNIFIFVKSCQNRVVTLRCEINVEIMKLCLNYGYVERNSREYRKALRQCRKNKKRFGVAFNSLKRNFQ